MTSGEKFRDRLGDELADLRPPPIGGIVGDALVHGRRIRRRARVFGVVGGTAALAGLAAGVVALGGFGGGGGGGGSSAVAPGGVARATTPTATPSVIPPPAPSRTPTPTPTPTPATSSSSSGLNTVIGTIPASWKPPVSGGTLTDPTNTDGQSVAELVIDNLLRFGQGAGSFFSGSSMSGMNANATFTWTTHSGSIRISASVSDGGADGKTPESVCHPAYETDYCAAGTLSDGSVVMVQHNTSSPSSDGVLMHSDMVTITRPDHAAINVVQWSQGPLTDDQLYQIVSDPRWGLTMDRSFVQHADAVIRPFSD